MRVAVASLALLATSLAAAPAAEAHPTPLDRKPHVTWTGTSSVAGDGSVVGASGKVRHGKHRVLLQVKIKGGWRTFATTRSKRSGAFAVSGALPWFGTHQVRIHTKGKRSVTRKTQVTVDPGYVPRGAATDYAFLSDQGRTWRINPCQTVRYQVNYDDTGELGLQLAQAAAAQLSWATGIKMKYVGPTHVIPYQQDRTTLPKGVDLVIAYADETEVPDLNGPPAADGLGGPLSGYAGRTASGQPVWMTTQAAVLMSTTYVFNGVDYPAMDGPTWTVGSTLIHELGHAFGLDHSTGADQIMYAGVGPADADGLYHARYAAGDLAGLQQVDLSQGCVRLERNRSARVQVAPTPTPLR